MLVLDTGAGYLALAPDLVRWLGLSDMSVEEMTFAPRPLRRMELAGFQQDVIGPVLSVDVRVIEQATDRKVLGLLGQQPLGSLAIRIDYRSDSLALIPMRRDGIAATFPRRAIGAELAASAAALAMARNASREALGPALSESATCIPFRLEGDGKILIRVRLSDTDEVSARDEISLVLDTGATKSVVFEKTMQRLRPRGRLRELRGLSAPTLYGSERASMARIPVVALASGGARAIARDVDFAVMESPLEEALSQAVNQPVDGLLGYSFLRRFRVTIDYPHRLLWLEPVPVSRDQRPDEYSHIGAQIERRGGILRVVAVAEGSPAEAAGVEAGDELVAVDGTPASALDVVSAARKLEGPPGSAVTLRLKRDSREKSYRLVRRELL